LVSVTKGFFVAVGDIFCHFVPVCS